VSSAGFFPILSDCFFDLPRCARGSELHGRPGRHAAVFRLIADLERLLTQRCGPTTVHAAIVPQVRAEVAVVAAGDNSEVAVSPESRKRLVFDALTAVIPAGQRPEVLDEQQELYGDLGMDSLRFVRLLVELESKLGVNLLDEELMTIDLVTVADLVDLVGRISPPAAE
jgi:acyl carrier protein